jgi:hypothetical protein
MRLLLFLLAVFSLTVFVLWIQMAIRLYRRSYDKGIITFFGHCFVAFVIVAVIWFIIISPVFFFEDEFPVEETVLFFVLIILILGAWPLIAMAYFKKNPVEVEEDEEIIDAEERLNME